MLRAPILGAAPLHPAEARRPPRARPASCSRLQSPPSCSRCSAPHSPAAAGCLQARLPAGRSEGAGATASALPTGKGGAPPGLRDPAPPRASISLGGEGATFPSPRRGGDGSGTTWKTSPGQTAGTPGAGEIGCRRAVAGPGRPPTSWAPIGPAMGLQRPQRRLGCDPLV